ncbi:NAD(P)-binding protein [Lentithecium fluviatile CBS 122367]|uniref:NAD(P)-binding protein n=1 Tax=Lentithecium fluviatile CBS 122367 TaxID=1168545 RepID=A0A6G1IS87_9PLEO|nr:NAD(P)-binding protein [Lentithecium fluviatile CBS 122367]
MDKYDDTILVTGGSGFLGSHVVDALIAQGRFRVVAVSRNPTRYCNQEAQYMPCDITNHNEVAAIIEQIKPIAIIHTATPGPFAPEFLHRKDHAATKNLVQIATQFSSVRAFVYTGSAEAMKNVSGARGKPLSETEAILHTPSTAPSGYAHAKSASDALVLQANDVSLATATLRLPAVYGPRETKDSGIATNFMSLANTFATRIQLGNNEVVLDWVYVENAAHAHVLAVNTLLQPQRCADGEAYFVTDGAPVKLWDFVRSVWTASGDENCNSIKKVIIPWWVVLALAATIEVLFRIFTLDRKSPPLTRLHVRYVKDGAWFSIGKARECLGYEPLVSTSEGIERTVAWLKHA